MFEELRRLIFIKKKYLKFILFYFIFNDHINIILTNIWNLIKMSLDVLLCPGQDVEKYQNGVRLDNRFFFRAPALGLSISKSFFCVLK